MSRMVSRSLSVDDVPLMEVGSARSFLRFAVAIPFILSRLAESTQATDVLLLPYASAPNSTKDSGEDALTPLGPTTAQPIPTFPQPFLSPMFIQPLLRISFLPILSLHQQ
jgi:hypothetical protein